MKKVDNLKTFSVERGTEKFTKTSNNKQYKYMTKKPNNQSVSQENEKLTKVERLEIYLKKFYDFRYNEVLNELEFRPKNGKKPFEPFSDRVLSDIRTDLQRNGFTGFKSMLDDLLNSSRFSPLFNPFKDYFENLPAWKVGDKDHIAELCSYLNPKNQEWFTRMFKKHLIRTVGCSLRILDFNKQCFVLMGKQNDGKSKFIRFLVPKQLQPYYKENPPLDHKDSVLALAQNFIINLDELHDLNKSDANKVKSLFSQSDTKVRGHYATKDTLQPRYASFFGTTNDSEFLSDPTGNVRWIVMPIDGILHDNGGQKGYNQNIDINDVWSQAYSLLMSGEPYELTKDEILTIEKENRAFQKTTPEIDLLSQYFESSESGKPFTYALTATDFVRILTEVTKGSVRLNSVSIGKALAFLKIEKCQIRLPYQKNPTYRYLVTSRENEILKIFQNNLSYLTTNDAKSLIIS